MSTLKALKIVLCVPLKMPVTDEFMFEMFSQLSRSSIKIQMEINILKIIFILCKILWSKEDNHFNIGFYLSLHKNSCIKRTC